MDKVINSFFDKIEGPDECGCLNWNAAINNKGYGFFWDGTKVVLAHRFSWEFNVGPTNGYHVLHKCDNPRCVNPEHLFIGTQSDNMKDAVKKNRIPRGETHHRSKLMDHQIVEIRERYAGGGVRMYELAKKFGVSRPLISMIINNKHR